MKRTNLVLDDQLLKQATEVLRTRTYSEAVTIALEQVIQLAQIRGILDFVGTGAWDGNLDEMREVHPRKRKKSR